MSTRDSLIEELEPVLRDEILKEFPAKEVNMRKSKRVSTRILCAAFSIVAISQFLSGCVTMSPEERAHLEKDAAQLITCTKGDDCDVKWGRAITWVSQNSQLKIQTQTDNLIQTYSAVGGSAASGFLVNKVPLGGGRYQIIMASSCDNFIGCVPDALTLKASFNRFVMGLPSQ